jgi:hypothetical protein
LAKIDANVIVAARLERRLVRNVTDLEREIYELVQRLLREFDIKDGQFVPSDRASELLARLNRELRRIVDRTRLEDDVMKFIDDFDQIDRNIKAIQNQLNGIQVPNNIFTDQRKWAIDATVNSLLESNINLRFVQPVKQLLYSRVAFGGSVVDAERQLKALVLGDGDKFGVLRRWVGQVARDTINEYQGAINQQIAVEYELNAFRYVGGLVEDSRPQCVRWIEEFGGVLRFDQLEKEIRWAYNNGTGMKPDTTPENFAMKRGGYNCIHECIPIRVK